MLALARKYRPRNFATVAVQSHVANTLKGAIARGRVANGYLLCGPRGVGKTTLARVLAMALNCEQKRDDGEPCGACPSCERIWSGSASLDVLEIDAASNRGVDDARDLRERAMYAPSGEHRYKVYIIDEAHMLTREAWNALLKILEEPPPRVVFVFATTEPQKIAQTAAPVLSRLQRFDFRRMSVADIRERLSAVLEQEHVPADADALGLIARAADGSMRDGLSLADQVLALGDGRLTVARVRETLGLVAEDEYLAIIDLIAERRAGDVFPAITRLVDEGVDLGQFLAGVSDMLRAYLAVTLGSSATGVGDAASAALRERVGKLSTADLVRMLSISAELEPNFRRSAQQQTLLEATLVRFALLDRSVDIEAVLRGMGGPAGGVEAAGSASRAFRPSERPREGSGGAGNRGSAAPQEALPAAESRVTIERAQERATESRSSEKSGRALRSGSEGPRATAAVAATRDDQPTLRREAVSRSRPVSTLDINSIVEQWDVIVAGLRSVRPIFGALLDHALPVAVTATGVLTLQLDDAGAHEGLSARLTDLGALMSPSIVGLTRVVLLPPNRAVTGVQPRMTAESIKAETLSAIRRRDPVISAAVDALDLELLD